MFNVTVLKIKDLRNYLIVVIVIFLVIYMCKNWFRKLRKKRYI